MSIFYIIESHVHVFSHMLHCLDFVDIMSTKLMTHEIHITIFLRQLIHSKYNFK